jgi:mannose-6-phosphate isomerase-like protein (cupin superfamily)
LVEADVSSAPPLMYDAGMTSLVDTYVHLRDDRSATPVNVTPTFWQELASGQRAELDVGRLVLQMHGSEDWPTWEMHPCGDELVILVSGEADMLLEVEPAQRVKLRQPGDFVRVPKGVWHTAKIAKACTLILITPGEGTTHRPV